MKVLDYENIEHEVYKLSLKFKDCDAYSGDSDCEYYHIISDTDNFCCEHPDAKGNKRGWLINCPIKDIG